MKYVYIFLIISAVLLAGCATKTQTPTGQQTTTTQQTSGQQNTTQNNKILYSTSRYARFGYLISGETIDAKAREALAGFNMTRTVNPDGTITIDLVALESQYKSHSYTLQPGEKLFFIETSLGDDPSLKEYNLGDDGALKVDSDGYIMQ